MELFSGGTSRQQLNIASCSRSQTAEYFSPYEPAWSKPVYHLYVVRVDNREALTDHLKSVGIGTAIHYPIPLHLQKAYASLNYQVGDFPVAEKVALEILSLPMCPQLTPGAARPAAVVLEIYSFNQAIVSTEQVA